MRGKKQIVKFARRKVAPPQLTGGEGFGFEVEILSLLATLMICDGEIAIFPNKRIVSVETQTYSRGFNLDDALAVFTDASGNESKLIAQIKHRISLTRGCQDFTDTIQAAWLDFCNSNLVDVESDAFILITGPLSRKDTCKFNTLLNMIRTCPPESFIDKIQRGTNVSLDVREFYALICEIISVVNDGEASHSQVHRFLNKFYILQPDNWCEGGVVESFALSLLKQRFVGAAPRSILDGIEKIMRTHNSNGGIILRDKLVADIKKRLCIQRREDEKVDLVQQKQVVVQLKSSLSQYGRQAPSFREDRLAILCLIGMWQEASCHDRDFVCKALNLVDSELDDFIHGIDAINPKVLTIESGLAAITNRSLLWQATAKNLSVTEVNRFLRLTKDELTLRDKKLALPPEERWLSTLESGIKCSFQLREGISQGLALLGAKSECCKQIGVRIRENWTWPIVRKCLRGVDWQAWATLNDLLPYLAEAAPDEYIDCVKRFLARKKEGLDVLLSQERPGIVSHTYSLGFIHALGLLAWMPEFFAVSLDLLAQITIRDKGGQWHPRAADVMRRILHPLGAHTIVSSARRIKVFCGLIENKYKAQLWDFIGSLLPSEFYSFTKEANWPLFRDVGITHEIGTDLDNAEVNAQFDAYARLAIKFCGTNFKRLNKLLLAAQHFNKKPFLELIAHAKKIVLRMSAEERYRVWKELHRLCRLARITRTKHGISNPNEAEHKLIDLEALYTPTEPQFRYRDLFSYTEEHYHQLESGMDTQAFNEELSRKQILAIVEIYDKCGTSGVVDFATNTDKSQFVGYLFGANTTIGVDSELLPGHLKFEHDKEYWVLAGFVAGRFEKCGWNWLVSTMNRSWTIEQKVMLLIMLPFRSDVWNVLPEILGKDINLYWKNTQAEWVNDKEDMERAIEGLLSVGRGYAAVDMIAHGVTDEKSFRVDLSKKILNEFVTGSVSDGRRSMTSYHLTKIFEILRNSPMVTEEEMARYEWTFFGLFDQFADFSKDRLKPVALERQLARDPEMFCQALEIAYLPAKRAKEIKALRVKQPLSSAESSRIESVWRLLHNWSEVPGVNKDGTFDGKTFMRWTKSVFAKSRKIDRIIPAQIILACAIKRGAPSDTDGFWMPHEIAAFMERKSNQKMLDSYGTAVFNSRGVYFVDKSMKADKELAGKYERQAEQAEEYGYVGLARVMRHQADLVMRMARENNEEDKIRDVYYDVKRKERLLAGQKEQEPIDTEE